MHRSGYQIRDKDEPASTVLSFHLPDSGEGVSNAVGVNHAKGERRLAGQ